MGSGLHLAKEKFGMESKHRSEGHLKTFEMAGELWEEI